MNRGAWRVTVHGIEESWTQLSEFQYTTLRTVVSLDLDRLELWCQPCHLCTRWLWASISSSEKWNNMNNTYLLDIHWKDWWWSWNSNTLATWCEELTYLKRPCCWERLKAGGEGDDRGWDGWMASLTWRTWVWVGSGSWWWTGKPGVLQSMGLQRVRHDWATELN